MGVLVYGGRRYNNFRRVFAELDAIHARTRITVVIQGESTGADALAKTWAQTRGIPTADFKADWDDLSVPVVRRKVRVDGSVYNAAAGGTRNKVMMAEGRPDIAVEFPGGDGTSNMRRIVQQEQKRRALIHIQVKKY